MECSSEIRGISASFAEAGPEAVKIVTGVRGSGKSTLLDRWAEHVGAGRVVRANGELDGLDGEDLLDRARSSDGDTLLLDEPGGIPGWERVVCALRGEGWNVTVASSCALTPSQVAVLRSAAKGAPAGSVVEVPVLPLSFVEWISARDESADAAHARAATRTAGGTGSAARAAGSAGSAGSTAGSAAASTRAASAAASTRATHVDAGNVRAGLLGEYLARGGLATLVQRGPGPASPRERRERLCQEILERDVLGVGLADGRRRLENPEAAWRLCELLAREIGRGHSSNSLGEGLKQARVVIASDTASAYLRGVERSRLFSPVARRVARTWKPLKTLGRHYAADTGLLNYFSGYESPVEGGGSGGGAEFGLSGLDGGAEFEACAHALENAVFLQLIRDGFVVSVAKSGDGEVDFLLERGGRRAYAQVAMNLEGPIAREEALRTLRRIPDPCPKFVIVGEGDYPAQVDGVTVIPAAEFLLGRAVLWGRDE